VHILAYIGFAFELEIPHRLALRCYGIYGFSFLVLYLSSTYSYFLEIYCHRGRSTEKTLVDVWYS
jgi:hypothetical protein